MTTLDAQERLDYLLESVWVPTNKPVLFADITEVVGLEGAALVVGTIKAATATNPLMDTILIAMSTVGLSLSTPERQGVIDLLADSAQWPDSVRDAVRALGGAWQAKWIGEGYEAEPTLEQIQTEITKRQLADAAADAYQAFRESLSAWDGTGPAPVFGGA